jgi:rhodanese-related sulfurtransferase
MGYTHVKVFEAGYPAWMKVKGNYASVSAGYMKKQIDAKADMVIVDSRPKRKKYDKGHLPGAISIPDSQFNKLKGKLPRDKSKPLVFYCGGFKCKLSHKSAAKAMALGYTKVKVFSAGYPAWKKTVASAAPVEVKAGKEEGSIDIDTFRQIMAENPGSVMLIDVRDKDEFETGSLKTAVNIPVDELETRIKTLPLDKPVVFICGTGARSGESYYMVQDVRPEMKNVFYLDAEMTVHEDGSFELKKPI